MKKHVTSSLRLPEIILIGTLAILLCLPAVIGFGWNNSKSMQQRENRKMAPCPPISLLQENPKQFITSLESFLNDRVGFRHLANKTYRKIRYYIFKDAPLQNISIGKDGFVFMNSHRLDKPNFVFNLLCEQQINPSKKLVDSMNQTFESVSRYFSSRGYNVTIAAGPTNIAIYPDKLPLKVDRKYRDACQSYGQSDTLLNQLGGLSRNSEAYKLYYPYQLFKDHRDEPYFFPKEKWHSTGRSVYLFARDLIYQTGVVDKLLLDDPAIIDFVGDDLRMFFGFSRKIKAYTYPYEKFDTQVDKPSWQFDISSRGGLFHYSTTNALTKKRGLLIANSFGIELAPHLARAFQDFYFFNLNVLLKKDEKLFFSKIAEATKPDYIYVLFDDAGIIAAPKRLAVFAEL